MRFGPEQPEAELLVERDGCGDVAGVQLQDELLTGYAPDTPAVVVVRATWPDEQVEVTTVAGLATTMAATGARTTMLVLVGPALAGAAPRCLLYDPTYAHGHRRRSTPGSTTGRPR